MAEYFSFLPYGKYAFYIWGSYLICFIVLALLSYKSIILHTNTIKKLSLKYNREQK